ncbi:MAG: ABC transporter permease [Peptostreptococcaceae bacterium]|nr:ABC transporter permease [Peptostreptococcaceae bacterium]
MLSKILPFNRTLLKKDWIINRSNVYIVILIFLIAGPYSAFGKVQDYYSSLDRARDIHDFYFRIQDVEEVLHMGVLYTMMFIFPAVVSALITGEEKRKRTIEISIGAPYSRYTVFFNKMVLGIFVTILPVLISGGILLLMSMTSGAFSSMVSLRSILFLMFKCMMIGISVFSFSTLIGMICSSFPLQAFLTLVFILFPIGFVGLLSENLRVWGIDINFYELGIMDFAESITPGLHFGKLIRMDGHTAVFFGLGLLCLALLLMTVSGILFDIYAVERGPEALTFTQTEPIFRIGVVLCSILLCGLLVDQIIRGYGGRTGVLLGYIIGGALGYLIPRALIMKNRVA